MEPGRDRAEDGACAIDLICGPSDLDVQFEVSAHRREVDGEPLCDHAEYVVRAPESARDWRSCRVRSLSSHGADPDRCRPLPVN